MRTAIQYKWQLRRSSRKEVCPSCGHRTFVPYVATADLSTMAGAEYGRCDRENNCGYHLYPNGVKTEEIKKVEVKPLAPMSMSYEAVAMCDGRSNLYDYAVSLIGKEKADKAWRVYKVGKWHDATVFWQIDNRGIVRGGKMIPYGDDGHRRKDVTMCAYWCHSVRELKPFCEGEQLRQCFFGEHLVTEGCRVAIVESEKTALIMSQVYPEWVFVASGGSQGINDDKCEALKIASEVKMFPDNGMYYKWRSEAMKRGYLISRYCESSILEDLLGSGYDILDVNELKNK